MRTPASILITGSLLISKILAAQVFDEATANFEDELNKIGATAYKNNIKKIKVKIFAFQEEGPEASPYKEKILYRFSNDSLITAIVRCRKCWHKKEKHQGIIINGKVYRNDIKTRSDLNDLKDSSSYKIKYGRYWKDSIDIHSKFRYKVDSLNRIIESVRIDRSDTSINTTEYIGDSIIIKGDTRKYSNQKLEPRTSTSITKSFYHFDTSQRIIRIEKFDYLPDEKQWWQKHTMDISYTFKK